MMTKAVIHLIDDDDGVRQSLAFSLTTAGLAVRAYESAVAFLEALPGLQPGCVVTDVRMPGIDGLELQRREAADLFADHYERLRVGASRHVDRMSTTPQYALALTRARSGPLVASGREAEWRS